MNFLLCLLLTLVPGVAWENPPENSENKTQVGEVSVEIVPVKEKNRINYDSQRPLTYDDFAGRPDQQNPGVAATHSVISIGSEMMYNQEGFSAQITISVFMDSQISWMKQEGRYPNVLAHEQLHFDITAYIACLMTEAIKNTTFTRDQFKQQLKELQEQFMRMREEMQQQYDRETQHGLNKKEQAAWAEKISKDFAQHYCY